MDKPKITEVYEDRILTRNERNEYGEWVTVQKEMRYKKDVNDLSVGLRLVNFIIDTIFYYKIVPILLDSIMPDQSNPIVALIYIFSFPLYYILCEYLFQKTVGKIFTQSLVVNEYGEKPDFKTIVVRTVIRFIPFEPFSFFSSSRGWHDRWTKTFVMRKEELDILLDLAKNPDNLKS